MSLSLFFSLIDVGTLVSLRLQGNNDELPKLTWNDFFAPGFFAICGLKNSPLSVGAGLQWGPQLIKINGEDVVRLDTKAWGIGLVAVIDIPLFYLYKTRK